MAKSKMELDKELMFSKIMPSASGVKRKKPLPVFEDEIEDDMDEIEGETPEEREDRRGGATTAAQNQAEFYSESLKSSIEQIMKPLERSASSIVSGIKIVETSGAIIFNMTEHVVTDRLEPAFEKFNCCKCDRCKKDVMALALNKLRPRYIVLPQNSPLPTPDQKVVSEVNTALIQAIIRVKANPRH